MIPTSVAPTAKLFRSFAEPSRLLIVDALRNGERTVSEICEATGLSQPNASNHLACLLGCRLVEREQRGRFAYYHLADARVASLLSLARELGAGEVGGAASCPVCGSDSW